MGLNLRVKNYNKRFIIDSKIGSYSGFHQFRKIWAKHLGFDLEEMQGFYGEKKWTNEPLRAFFNHSDCEGKISVKDCKNILKQATKDYPKLKDDFQCAYSFPILIKFCKAAIKNNEPLEFH